MEHFVDKAKLQEFATKLHTKQKTVFAPKAAVGSPLVAATAAAMTDTEKVYVYTGSETGYTSGNWYYYNGSAWVSGGVYNAVAVQTDDTLSVAGMAADAAAVGEALASDTGSGLTADVKEALLDCFAQVTWKSQHGADFVGVLRSALYPPANLVRISAVYTQSGTVYDTDTLNSLKSDLVVTAHYSDSTTETISNYALSGTLAEGTSTITVSYGGKNTTFNVTVTHYADLIYNAPMTFIALQTGSEWNSETESGFVYGRGTGNWPALLLQNLKYLFGAVQDKSLRVRCTFVVSGSDGSGSGYSVTAGLYTNNNPDDNSSKRRASATMYSQKYDGTYEVDVTRPISEMFPNTSYPNPSYLGVSFFVNGKAGSTVTVSNIVMELV